MKTRHPTPKDIQELLAFLPAISAPDFVPVKDWDRQATGWPNVVYDPVLDQFFDTAIKDCWQNYEYLFNRVRDDFMHYDRGLEDATLEDLKALLTFFIRGERLSGPGWLGSMFKEGRVRSVLERLAELDAQGALAKPRRKRSVK
jgi:hypothetical protein